MTYRHGDNRNDFRSREEKYLDDQRRLDRRDPYFAHDEKLVDYDEANDDWYDEEYHADEHVHPSENHLPDEDTYHTESSTAEYEYQSTTHTGATYDDQYYEADRVDPEIADDRPALPNESIRIEADDLRDVDQSGAFPKFGKGMAKIAALCCFLVFAVLMFLSMQPDVTAYDIISMQEYEGEQKPDWVLDSETLSECDSLSECFKKELSLAEQKSTSSRAVQEIPAVNVVATEPVAVVSEQPDAENIVSLPSRMKVARQWSNIRQSAGMSGVIIGSIARANEVEVLGKEASWFQIRTLDGRDIKGFMHSNTLEE